MIPALHVNQNGCLGGTKLYVINYLSITHLSSKHLHSCSCIF